MKYRKISIDSTKNQATDYLNCIFSFLPCYTHNMSCAYQGNKKCSFFGKFGVLCFLKTPVLRFALLPYYRRIHKHNCNIKSSTTTGRTIKNNFN